MEMSERHWLRIKIMFILESALKLAAAWDFAPSKVQIASMVSNGECRIKKIVAVLKGGKVIPPCGRCREFILQIHKDNINTEIIIKKNKTAKLKDILSYRWN